MNKKYFFIATATVALMGLSACSSTPKRNLDEAHYWQRANTVDAIYQRGPKAQHMLHRDISRCVVEIRELERLGSIRRAIPRSQPPHNEIPEMGAEGWDTPERNGTLYAEHSDYHDFEGCMNYGGWERIKHVPYDVAKNARETYIETIMRKDPDPIKKRSKVRSRQKQDGDFDSLND